MPVRLLMAILEIIFKGREINNKSGEINFMETAKNVTLLGIAIAFATTGGAVLSQGDYLVGAILEGCAIVTLIIKGVLGKYGIDAGAKKSK